jgi:ketosteroid isomerase-like protein
MTPDQLVLHLRDVTNAHDLVGIVDCFAANYRNVMPLHPERGFTGKDQVRRNWAQILGAIPDVVTRVISTAVSDDCVWSEWEHSGTRPDGSAHLMRGVIIFTVGDDEFTEARFYLEPVAASGPDIDDAVGLQVRPGTSA